MVVIILEKAPMGLRGELTRWMIEPHPGVFVGHVSALVRDRLWQKCCAGARGGGVVQLWSTNNEQRFQVRTSGVTRREVVDFDGLQLIRLPVESENDKQEDGPFAPAARRQSRRAPRGW